MCHSGLRHGCCRPPSQQAERVGGTIHGCPPRRTGRARRQLSGGGGHCGATCAHVEATQQPQLQVIIAPACHKRGAVINCAAANNPWSDGAVRRCALPRVAATSPDMSDRPSCWLLAINKFRWQHAVRFKRGLGRNIQCYRVVCSRLRARRAGEGYVAGARNTPPRAAPRASIHSTRTHTQGKTSRRQRPRAPRGNVANANPCGKRHGQAAPAAGLYRKWQWRDHVWRRPRHRGARGSACTGGRTQGPRQPSARVLS